MAGLRPPEKDIGPARAPAWAGIAVLGVFVMLLLAFALLERLGLRSQAMPQAVCAAALAAFAITAIVSHARRLDDFYLADREIAPAAAGAGGAAGFAGLLTIGLATGAFRTGGEAAVAAIGLLAGFVIAALALAPKLRRSGGISLGDVFHVRFGARGRLAIAAASGLASFLMLLALLTTAGALVAAFVGLSARGGLAAATAVIVFATLPGGLRSLRATQAVQFAVIVGGCLLACALLAIEAGDFGVVQMAGSDGLQSFGRVLGDLAEPGALAGTGPTLALMALGTASLPQVLVAASSARSGGGATASLLWTVGLSVALLIGGMVLSGVVTSANDPIAGLIGDELFMASGPLFAALPPLPAGLLMAGTFAALLAAAQASLLAAANVLSHDLGDELFDRDGPPGRRIFAARLAVAIVGSAAAWLATAANLDPTELLGWALAIAAAGIFAPLALALWWPGCTADGITTGTLAGLGVGTAMFLFDLGAGSSLIGATGLADAGSTAAAALGIAAATLATLGGSLVERRFAKPPPADAEIKDEPRRRRRRQVRVRRLRTMVRPTGA